MLIFNPMVFMIYPKVFKEDVFKHLIHLFYHMNFSKSDSHIQQYTSESYV